MSRYPLIDLAGVTRFPFAERPTKVSVADFGRPRLDDDSFAGFLDSLPDVLVARDLKQLARQTAGLLAEGRGVTLMMGAHVIKTGLSPLLIELLERQAIDCVALNGAGVIHDVEVALFGRTSEDVAANLETGRFGFVEETALVINAAVTEGAAKGWGYGESIARKLEALNPPHAAQSLLLAAWRQQVPLTVHVALGTETIHQHPESDGGALGEASYRDFRILCQHLTGLEGGMVLLYGSAVILPEVFLKALTVVRNLGHRVNRFTAVNFDMIQHYRPQENVVSRPTRSGGKGFTVIGHHEIMVPLFWQAVFAQARALREGKTG